MVAGVPPRTFLVTGAAGFIGSNLVTALVERGDKVRAVDDLSTGKRANLDGVSSRIEFFELDVNDLAALRDACTGVACVFHQAAIPSVPRSVADPLTSHRANVDGTLNVLLACRDAGVQRVVYAGSSSAYGETAALPKHEAMKPDPISPYAVQKLTGELYLRSFYRVYGLETVVLRYFNVFGPRQDSGSPYSGVLAKFITSMLAGEAPTIYGDGEQSRDYTYVDNVVQANLLAADASAERAGGRTFNVAGGVRYTLNEVVALLKAQTGFAGEPVYAAARTGDVRHSLADVSAARALGYVPRIDFIEGLRRTVEWYRKRPAP